MKKLIVLFTMLLTTPALADYCSSYLKDGNYTVRTFQSYGYNAREACNQAMRECRYEKQRLSYDRRYRNLHCTSGFNPAPGQNTCTYQAVVNDYRRSRVVGEYSARGQNQMRACNKAQNKCIQSLRHAPYGTRCIKKMRRGGQDYVTRTCTATKMGRRGVPQRSFYGTATGPRGTGIKRQACNRALRQCQMSSGRGGRCVVRN